MKKAIALAALSLALSIGLGVPPRRSLAACNSIPGTTQTFRGAAGHLDRPFAGPGQRVEIRQGTCDPPAAQFAAAVQRNVVTVVFKPPRGGDRHIVVLAADCGLLGAEQKTCPGLASVPCIAGARAGLRVEEIEGERRLGFRFPDSDEFFEGREDDLTFTGPAAIAVTDVDDPLPCGLLETGCAGQTGLLACVDELFANDSPCGSTPHPTFSHFTALPPPNDYQGLCFEPRPPCQGDADEVRFTVDAGGNVLLPMDWGGILVSPDLPIARLLRGSTSVGAEEDFGEPIRIPSNDFLAAFSLEGSRLPPIFDPQTDLQGSAPLTLFGTADAQFTVLRIARKSPTGLACSGPEKRGEPCSKDENCGGPGSCQPAEDLFDFDDRLRAGSGPIVVPRRGPGLCQTGGNACEVDAECTTGDLCVRYRLEAGDPVPLDGLVETDDLLAFVVSETIGDEDLNGDADRTDDVLVAFDRRTGLDRPIGTPTGAQGRAATRIRQPPFTFPAIASEGDLVAFLEAEPLQGKCATESCDQNQDGDAFDSLLRVFRFPPEGVEDLTENSAIAVDAAPLVDGRSVVISDGLVFFRRPESAACTQRTVRVSVDSQGEQGAGASGEPAITPDGRFVAFSSLAPLVPGDTNLASDVFVRDRLENETLRASVTSLGGEADGASRSPSISDDGLVVAFDSDATLLVDDDRNPFSDVFVHDRASRLTTRASIAPDGLEANQISLASDLSGDGRIVAFSTRATNLAPDENRAADVFVHDVESRATTRVSLGFDGTEPDADSFEPSLSSDGSSVAFASIATNVVENDTNGPGFSSLFLDGADVFVHDDREQRTLRVSLGVRGVEGAGGSSEPDLSADGRVVAFSSFDNRLVAGDTNGRTDVFVHDRGSGVTQRVSQSSAGEQAFGENGGPSLSPDGRYVAFLSAAPNLAPGDVPTQFGRLDDVFVHDRVTGFTERVGPFFRPAEEPFVFSVFPPAISSGGRSVAFTSWAPDLVPGDGNRAPDVFVRGCDPADSKSDLTRDGDLDDTVLQVLDARGPSPTPVSVGAAGSVAIFGGMAAFLSSESASGSSLNGDEDADDEVVHLYQGRGRSAENLERAATAVSLSADVVAALVPEAGQGDGSLNGDTDTDDAVVQVYDLHESAWKNVAEAADVVGAAGSIVAFLTPEAAQGRGSLNADTDADDRVLQLYDAGTGSRVNVGVAAEEFVLGETLIAFRTPEKAGGESCDLNRDLDCDDDVLQIYNLRPDCLMGPPPPGCLINTEQAVTPCRLEACDPRIPYRVSGGTVRFLTFEGDQGGDLNGDLDEDDVVLQVFNAEMLGGAGSIAGRGAGGTTLRPEALVEEPGVRSAALTAVAAVVSGVCTTTGKPCGSDASCQGGTCFVPPGGCVEDTGNDCEPSAPNCRIDEFCAPSPNDPDRRTCQSLLGAPRTCMSDEECRARSPSATCNDAGQTFQRFVAPLAQPDGTGLLLPSARGRCARDPDRTCLSERDCPDESACGNNLIVAAAGDSDRDQIADPFDNCPFRANTSQLDSDGDGAGDACDAVPVPCTGDCNQDGKVAIAELIQGVRIALGAARLRSCPPDDVNRDGAVSVDELVRAVGSALQSCRGGS